MHEMADAAGLGVKVCEEKIAVQPETAQICRHFKLDPLQLISSGALLVAAESGSADGIIARLGEKKVQAAIIGEFCPNPAERTLLKKNGAVTALPRPKSDHLWKALGKP